MLGHYNREYFVEHIAESTPSKILYLSGGAVGLDWNYYIARHLDRDLHEKLLSFDSALVLPLVNVLPLISSGYFYTAKQIVENAEIDPALEDVRQWLVQALTEADDT